MAASGLVRRREAEAAPAAPPAIRPTIITYGDPATLEEVPAEFLNEAAAKALEGGSDWSVERTLMSLVDTDVVTLATALEDLADLAEECAWVLALEWVQLTESAEEALRVRFQGTTADAYAAAGKTALGAPDRDRKLSPFKEVQRAIAFALFGVAVVLEPLGSKYEGPPADWHWAWIIARLRQAAKLAKFAYDNAPHAYA